MIVVISDSVHNSMDRFEVPTTCGQEHSQTGSGRLSSSQTFNHCPYEIVDLKQERSYDTECISVKCLLKCH